MPGPRLLPRYRRRPQSDKLPLMTAMVAGAEATIAAREKKLDPHDTSKRESYYKTNSLEQGPTALVTCFPSSFLPFLRSNRSDINFNLLLAYWGRNPENVKFSAAPATLKFSFGIALDRAMQRDWEMATAFLLNGAFLEQCQRCGGLDHVAEACLGGSDKRDRVKLFGLYFRALRASQSQETTLRFLEKKVDKEQLSIIQMRNNIRKRNVAQSKRKPVEAEPGSNLCPSSPVSIDIIYQEASNYVQEDHEFIVPPNQEIRLVLAKYAKTIRKVPLRSLRFTFPIDLSELDGMDKTAAEHLTFEGLGLSDRRIRVFCTTADSVERPSASDVPTEMKTPTATSVFADSSIPDISPLPLPALLTPDRPGPTFLANSTTCNKRVKYSHPLITSVNSQQVTTTLPPEQGALVSPGTPHSHQSDKLCMLSHVATSLATKGV